MTERIILSKNLRSRPEGRNQAAIERILIARKRVQSILDREITANRRTLEQKISDQGPANQRVDPHLVGLAIMDMLELKRLRSHKHPSTGTTDWYSNTLTSQQKIDNRLNELAPLYAEVSGSAFGNLTGDALELIVFKCLQQVRENNPKYSYLGAFFLDRPKNQYGRYQKKSPPKDIGIFSTRKEADFIQFGHETAPLCIECKNYREWIYPTHGIIRELIIKSVELDCHPLLIARRIHYSTITNFFEPAGIFSHETYNQYYPLDKNDIAEKVRNKGLLGFTDVLASETPQIRTVKFFAEILPKITPHMAERWQSNRDALMEYATGNINLAQLYTDIGSQAGGKWQEQFDPEPFDV